MAGRTLYDIEDVSNLVISNENVSYIIFCYHGLMQVMLIPVVQRTMTAFNWPEVTQLDHGARRNTAVQDTEFKQLYIQVVIGGLCWLHFQRGDMLGVVLDGCLVSWHPAFVLLMAYPVQKFFHIQGVTGGTDQTSGGCSLC